MVTIIDLRAKGNTTHEMYHHTAAHGQDDVFNFCDDRSCIMESNLIAILPKNYCTRPPCSKEAKGMRTSGFREPSN